MILNGVHSEQKLTGTSVSFRIPVTVMKHPSLVLGVFFFLLLSKFSSELLSLKIFQGGLFCFLQDSNNNNSTEDSASERGRSPQDFHESGRNERGRTSPEQRYDNIFGIVIFSWIHSFSCGKNWFITIELFFPIRLTTKSELFSTAI